MARAIKKEIDRCKNVMVSLTPEAFIILNKEKRNKSRFVSHLLELYGEKLLNS